MRQSFLTPREIPCDSEHGRHERIVQCSTLQHQLNDSLVVPVELLHRSSQPQRSRARRALLRQAAHFIGPLLDGHDQWILPPRSRRPHAVQSEHRKVSALPVRSFVRVCLQFFFVVQAWHSPLGMPPAATRCNAEPDRFTSLIRRQEVQKPWSLTARTRRCRRSDRPRLIAAWGSRCRCAPQASRDRRTWRRRTTNPTPSARYRAGR